MLKAYTNAIVFTGEKFVRDQILITENGRIQGFSKTLPKAAEVIDCAGNYLAPGLLDLQIYGGGGSMFYSSLTKDGLFAIADAIVKTGTPGFFISLATNSMEVFKKAVEVVKDHPHPAVLGINLEGPYINSKKKGAHLEKYIKKPDLAELEDLLKFGDGVIKMMTVAPEMVDESTIQLLQKYQVLVSAGHSDASFEQAMQGFKWGIPAVTHLFNAMSGFHHREPGLPGAVFSAEHIYASIIPDGLHVHKEVIKTSKKILGERLFYITDGVAEVKEGEYIHLKQGDYFRLPDGTLSGSALTMAGAVRFSVQELNFSLEESLRMSSLYPAKVAGIQDQGKIEKGYKANFTCLSPQLDVVFTTVEDQIIKA